MKTIRKLGDKLVDEYLLKHCRCCRQSTIEVNDFKDSVEAFAREIRNEALEDAAASLTCIGECEHCEGCEHAAEIRNLKTNEEK